MKQLCMIRNDGSIFGLLMTGPQMIVHARFFFGRTGESAALAAVAKVDLMPLEVTAEHST